MLLTCWYSQTGLLWDLTNMPFYTITNLQGSQTFLSAEIICSLFYTITNLQGSQTVSSYMTAYYSFTPLQTYKVLKRVYVGKEIITVLHHYKLTRFSNWRDVDSWAIEFYTITNLQGSQTDCKTFEP